MRVCFSGTFNVLHKGHKHLIDTAFKTAGENGTVFIGITKGKLLHKKKVLVPFHERLQALNKYLETRGYDKKVVIVPITHRLGPAASGDYDAIIVSPETYENAEKINRKRIKDGKKPLKIIKISYVKAEDNTPISSTRILTKEIDSDGKILNTE